MFRNDQLTRNERIRLESLNQAIQFTRFQDGSLIHLFERAEEIEGWLKKADLKQQ